MREWNDIAVLAPGRDIDIQTAPALRDQIDALLASGTRRIIINCLDVTFIDSTGMAVLLSRARSLIARDGMLSLVNASPEVVRFMQIARLVQVLHVSPAQKPPVSVLAPGISPEWSRTLPIVEGIEHLGFYRHRVVELLESLRLTREDVFDTALAASEAIANAYDHAEATGSILNVRAYADRVVVEVCDRGEGFEIAPDEEPDMTEERGRGIRLMRMLVDSVEVKRRSDAQGTMVRLIKLLDPVPTVADEPQPGA